MNSSSNSYFTTQLTFLRGITPSIASPHSYEFTLPDNYNDDDNKIEEVMEIRNVKRGSLFAKCIAQVGFNDLQQHQAYLSNSANHTTTTTVAKRPKPQRHPLITPVPVHMIIASK